MSGMYPPDYCRNPDDESTQSAGPSMTSYQPDEEYSSVVDNKHDGVFTGAEGAASVGPPNMNIDLGPIGKNRPRPIETTATTYALGQPE